MRDAKNAVRQALGSTLTYPERVGSLVVPGSLLLSLLLSRLPHSRLVLFSQGKRTNFSLVFLVTKSKRRFFSYMDLASAHRILAEFTDQLAQPVAPLSRSLAKHADRLAQLPQLGFNLQYKYIIKLIK